MNSAQQTTVLPGTERSLGGRPTAPTTPARRVRVRAEHVALAAVMTLSAVLNINRLDRNEWANVYYTGAVRSMLHSLHNFVFASFDQGGLITVDKPPLGLWVQATSAKIFGFHPLSLLLPEALAGVLAVGALYWVVKPRFGAVAGVASALALAVFPSFVAVSRDNNLDAVLILLMVLACGVGLRAIESGRLRTLVGCAVLVGLAYNTKTLAAYLVVPGLALGYLVCAPGSVVQRVWRLLAAGAVLLAVSASWTLLVELTPTAKRPFVGGSTNNTELGLTFGYNGFGRVGGQVGGPGRIPVVFKHGSLAHIEKEVLRRRALAHARAIGASTQGLSPPPAPAVRRPPAVKPALPKFLPDGRAIHPTAFGGPVGPLRLFGTGLGGQGGWMIPFAMVGLIALALWSVRGAGEATPAPRRRTPRRGATGEASVAGEASTIEESPPGAGDGARWRNPRVAAVLVLGGWFLVETAVLSLSKGIVHPYYLSALGPGVAAMVGGGAVALVAAGPHRRARMALIPLAVGATVAAQLVLLKHEHYLRWLWPVLIIGAAVGVLAMLAARRWAGQAMAVTLGLLLLAPCIYAATTWDFQVEGTFPAAGPHAAAALGRFGIPPRSLVVNRELLKFIDARHPGTRWSVLTEASDTAAPMILLGSDAGAMGGYSGNDPALDGRSLARLVRHGEARYVVLGGGYAERGGNAASTAVLDACTLIPTAAWQPPPVNSNALLLYDCKHRERDLERSHGGLRGL